MLGFGASTVNAPAGGESHFNVSDARAIAPRRAIVGVERYTETRMLRNVAMRQPSSSYVSVCSAGMSW